MIKIIALDLDGVIIGRPPCISKSVIEYLYRDHSKKNLSYRFPSFLEQQIRKLSHLPFVRSPMTENLELVKDLDLNKNQLLVISGRFGFLKDLTYRWLDKYQIREKFKQVYLNTDNLQPHLFKEKMLSKIKVDLFVDDDFETLTYLASRFPRIQFYYYSEGNHHETNLKNVTKITDLGKILK